MAHTTTDRRSFLKTGSLVAAPLAMVAPAAAFADDGSRARLARLEDERAIEALQRRLLRQLNGTGEVVAPADALELGEGLCAIAEDMDRDTTLELSTDGLAARARCACRVERETEFTGDTTLEQMARFQGQGSHRHEARNTLATEFVKGKDGWTIARARLA
jgi:hypothetical protein